LRISQKPIRVLRVRFRAKKISLAAKI